MSKLPILILTIFAIILLPTACFAWGPGAHIGISLTILDKLPDYLKLLLMSNINEYLYGSLAPDFIIGKTLSEKDKHSHNWDIGFLILKRSKTDAEKAFAYGYLSHLGADAVAHGILANNFEKKLKNAKHTYVEMVADNMCNATYKQLAKTVLKKYNKDLDSNFKELVDSVLFSFGVSKLIFKGMVRVSLGRKKIKKFLLNPRFFELFSVDLQEIKEYIELSKEFSIDVLRKGMDSPVVRISAISE